LKPPNSINIGLESNFAMWVGELIPDLKQEILIVAANTEKVEETIIRLSRVGFDFAVGYLDGGFETWKNARKEVDTVKRITAQELEQRNDNTIIFDVRKISEFKSEHLVDAKNIPLNEINNRMEDFPKDQPFILHCAGGYRSMIAASMLKQRGFDNFVDVIGGFTAIKNTKLPVTNYVCPTSLL
jgi:rhodanese-related sulfurtransferase